MRLHHRKWSIMEVNWWIHLNHISPQETKRRASKDTQTQVFSCYFCGIFKIPFYKNTYGNCFWRWAWRNQTTAHEFRIEQMLSLNDLLWIILAIRQENCIPLSRAHYIHHTKYKQKVDKPTIGGEADMVKHRADMIIHKCINA